MAEKRYFFHFIIDFLKKEFLSFDFIGNGDECKAVFEKKTEFFEKVKKADINGPFTS
jgi:hypothetical protein